MKTIKFGKYSGINIPGTILMDIDVDKDGIITHQERASWLTAQVESGGKFGNVMNYDGTGLTAGIHQAVAVYPRDLKATGSLWGLLGDIRVAAKAKSPIPPQWTAIENMFEKEGIVFAVDNCLRWENTGKKLNGEDIRVFFNGNKNGVMSEDPSLRHKLENLAILFHELFSAGWTFDAQVNFGIKHFANWADRKMRFCKTNLKKYTINQFVYQYICGNDFAGVVGGVVPPVMDLAMSVFWSHSVNAPGEALKMFCRAADKVNTATGRDMNDFPKVLIKQLGTDQYGRWDDDIKNGRYQRTRAFAMKIWPKELFEGDKAVMPNNFPG